MAVFVAVVAGGEVGVAMRQTRLLLLLLWRTRTGAAHRGRPARAESPCRVACRLKRQKLGESSVVAALSRWSSVATLFLHSPLSAWHSGSTAWLFVFLSD